MKQCFLFSILCAVAFVSCHAPSSKQSQTGQDSLSAVSSNHAGTQPADHPDSSAKTKKPFDITKIPVSDKPLGAFPYFGLPEGYEANSDNKPQNFGHFPFWVGDHFEWIEGKIFYNNIYPKEGKTFSQYEVEKSLDNLITSAGGLKVFQGKIPDDSMQALGNAITVTYVDGIGDVYNDPASVYVIRRKGKNIWIQLCISNFSGGWIIAETNPFVQTASLIPADDLKKQIDATGKAIIHVNFATDKADILPESQPQVTQVLALLQQNKDLKLSVNGYTDNTGTVAHNQQLSIERAQSVVKALTDKGIDKSRLQSEGFGQNDPVADNNTDAGKAQNRRVELVKIQ